MENFELFLEKSHTQRDYYSAGEEIKGHVAISTKGRVRVARLSLRFIGAAHTEWHDKCTGAPFESVDKVLDEYRDLTSELSSLCDGSTELSPGEHSVAFHFKLPMDSVSTIAKDGHGVVKYFCVASLDLPDDGGDNEIVAEKEFAVTAYLNLDAPHFREPAHSSEQMTKGGVFCGRIRRVKAELCVEELGLMTGETCEVTLTVENTAKRGRRKSHAGEGHKCGLISLCQQVDFKAKAKTGEWQKRSLTTAVQSQGICKANCAKKPETRRTQKTDSSSVLTFLESKWKNIST
ncbi:hypothetical protein niasHT_002033 [Heterodera trifolii]|uniref:Arrestin-like N-terminal domain-containing protein n=1 Tax=Heterodera trifolii TaxID=157864 RepID=A0ABD2M2Q3_9BILA